MVGDGSTDLLTDLLLVPPIRWLQVAFVLVFLFVNDPRRQQLEVPAITQVKSLITIISQARRFRNDLLFCTLDRSKHRWAVGT